MRRQYLGVLLLSSTALGIAAACGPGFLDGLTGGGADGGGPPPGDDAGEICDPLVAPTRPTGDGPPGPEVYFAFEQIKIDTNAPPDGGLEPPQGLDLDGLCTCHPSARACMPASANGDPNAGEAQCDPDGGRGRDDALGELFNALIATIQEAKTDFATERIRLGQFTIMVDVRAWNGSDNDQSVDVTLLGSQLLDRIDGGRAAAPRFDGTDTWTLDPLSLFEGESKLGRDCRIDVSFCNATPGRIAAGQSGNAYVKDGVLVAKFRSAPFVIGTNIGDLLYDAEEPTLVAKISKDPSGRTRLVGEVSGRWRSDKALAAISPLLFPDTTTGALVPLCTQPSFYGVVKQAVCSLADLPLTPDLPSTSLCQTLSASIAFSAGEVQRPSFVARRTDGGGPCASFQDDCIP